MVRTAANEKGEPWFCAKNLCDSYYPLENEPGDETLMMGDGYDEYWEDAYRRWVDNMSFLVIKVKVIKVIKLFAWSLESAF